MWLSLLILAFHFTGCRTTAATYEELQAWLDAIELPSGFVLVSFRESGDSFLGPPPYVERSYAAPWDEGQLCAELITLASRQGKARPDPEDPCVLLIDVVSFWGRPKYEVRIAARTPDLVHQDQEQTDCKRDEEWAELHGGSQWRRNPVCSVPPGRALVTIRIASVH